MSIFVKALWIRTRTALGGLRSRSKDNINKETRSPGTVEPGQVSVPVSVSGSNDKTPASSQSQSETISDSFMPVRICPHCGYEIRTWILGDLSCVRCENDIHTGEGIVPNLYYRASDVSCGAESKV